MDPKSSNKITEIVRLQQMLKKWKKLVVTPKSNSKNGIKFLKKTLSFSENSLSRSSEVPKGFVAVCVGEEMRRFVIPMQYLGHKAFVTLLREAEEEFGFEQEGILRIPCEVRTFESILKVVERNKDGLHNCSSEAEFSQLCLYSKIYVRQSVSDGSEPSSSASSPAAKPTLRLRSCSSSFHSHSIGIYIKSRKLMPLRLCKSPPYLEEPSSPISPFRFQEEEATCI